MATDKVVDNIGVTNALLNGLGVAQVIFLYWSQTHPLNLNKIYGSKTPYHEDNSAKITSDLQVSLGHLLTVRNDNGASLASCGPLVHDPIGVQQTLNLPSLLTM